MTNLLRSALQILSLAVEADESSLFDEAVRLYDRGSAVLEQYLQTPPPSPQAAAAVTFKLNSYKNRSSFIKLKLGMDPLERATSPTLNTQFRPGNSSVATNHMPVNDNKSNFSSQSNQNMQSNQIQHQSVQPMTELQHALDLAKKAREDDQNGDFQAAFTGYKRCVDAFVKVIKAEQNDLIKSSLTKTVKTYIARAEQLKTHLNDLPVDPTHEDQEVYNASTDLSDNIIPENQKHRENSDTRIGPLAKEKSTTFWNDSSPLFFRVDIGHNIVHPGSQMPLSILVDNRSSIYVDSIKIYLQEFEILTSHDRAGNKTTNVVEVRRNKCLYTKKGIFPLSKGTYEGSIIYEIPADTMLTEVDRSSTFAREHRLKLQCEIPRHKNLVLEFPIRVCKNSE